MRIGWEQVSDVFGLIAPPLQRTSL
jgi:hypothetical protein